MQRIDTLEKALEQLLNDVCVDLGFCLPSEKRQAIASRPQIDAREFACAVLSAEGFTPEYEKHWLRKLSDRFEDRLGKGVVRADNFKL